MTTNQAAALKGGAPDASITKQALSGSVLETFDPRKIKDLSKEIRPHPVTGRLIDSHPGKRTKPMRVLCMGMSRTGTMSIFTALTKLGYTPYHMAVALGSAKNNLNLWNEGLMAKFHGQGKKWGREEFDKLIGDYDAILDVPGIVFVEELVAAYPEAKVVLNNRDLEAWLKSMDSTLGSVARWNMWDMISPWDPTLANPWWKHAKNIVPIAFGSMTDFSSPNCPPRKKFVEHYSRVRRVTPKERLLEFKVQDGWEPLCKFLDKPVPKEEFPRVNDADQFVQIHGMMWWIAFTKMFGKIGAMIFVPSLGLVAAWWWQRR